MRIAGLTNQYANIRREHVFKPWSFHFAAWRAEGDEVVIDGLKINLPVSPFEWPKRKSKIRPANIVACEVTWPPAPAIESWESQSVTLLKWLVVGSDPDLDACQQQMLNPPAKMECAFGTLHRDERFDQMNGSVVWSGEPIKITINGEFGGDAAGQAEVFASILADQDKWNDRMATIIREEFLLWRDTWAQDDELGMSCADYATHFRLESIEMISTDMLSFWLDDGGLYGGHAIELRGNPGSGFEQFALQG
jgi:hypothetical protein